MSLSGLSWKQKFLPWFFLFLLKIIIKSWLQEQIGQYIPSYSFLRTTSRQHISTAIKSHVYLWISTKFLTVWHKGLLYKLHKLNTSQYSLYTIKNLLENRTAVSSHRQHAFLRSLSPPNKNCRKVQPSHHFSTTLTFTTYTTTISNTKIKLTKLLTYYNTRTTLHLLCTTKLPRKRYQNYNHWLRD